MRTVIGIDPSLGGFAVATGNEDGMVGLEEWRTKPSGKDVSARMARIEKLVRATVALVEGAAPELVVIEGYSFASSHGTIAVVELGAVLRARLHEMGLRLVEVPPSTLKKWATGKGNAPKAAMVSAVSRRFDRAFSTDNQADAYALFELGRQLAGLSEPTVAHQRDVVAKLGPVALPGPAAAAE